MMKNIVFTVLVLFFTAFTITHADQTPENKTEKSELLKESGKELTQTDSLKKNPWVEIKNKKRANQDMFDLFFDHLETLSEKERKLEIEYFEIYLNSIILEKKTVPLVILQDEKGKLIQNQENSRNYLVSEAYNRLLDYFNDTLGDEKTAEFYGNKGINICPLNPDLLFNLTYLKDESTETVKAYEKILALTTRSDELLDQDLSAIYNNLGYAIWASDLEEKYDKALYYLKAAYFEGNHENALATMSRIYMYRDEHEKAVQVLRPEVIKFFKMHDEDLEGMSASYGYFLRALIDTANDLNDTKTASYTCKKYLKYKDNEYEECIEPELTGLGIFSNVLRNMFTKKQEATDIFWKIKENESGERRKTRKEEKASIDLLSKVLLSPKDYKQYQAFCNEANVNPKNFFEKYKDQGMLDNITPESTKREIYLWVLYHFLEESKRIINIDWKGESEPHQLKSHIADKLKERNIEDFSWDFYDDIRKNYDFENADSGDYIIDLLSVFASNLAQKNLVLVNFDMGGDNYLPFLVSQREYDKIRFLKTSDWAIKPYDKALSFPRKKSSRGVFDAKFSSISINANKGDAESQFKLGLLYLKGDFQGIEKDTTKGLQWLTKAAEQNHLKSQIQLGLLYADNDDDVTKNTEISIKWLTMAAEQGDRFAQISLGTLYLEGVGVKPDKTLALKWLSKAVVQENNDAEVQLLLGQIFLNGFTTEKEIATGISLITSAADQGNTDAITELSLMYYKGILVEKNLKAAASWFQKAANMGNANAQYNLGYLYENGEGVGQDITVAMNWYLKAAKLGSNKAQYNLGLIYRKNKDLIDKEASLKWYKKAAAQNYLKASNDLGFMYHHGILVEKDLEEAIKWYRKVADSGFTEAQFNLGNLYSNEKKNQELALKWYGKAARLGHSKSQYNLAYIYHNGVNVEKDINTAVKWYSLAAEQGIAPAQYFLGLSYHSGQGIKQNKSMAAKWYLKAAEQGQVDAQYSLGYLYENGEGVKQDKKKAVKWYSKAVEQNHPKAQYMLGLLYYYGEGVVKNKEKSIELLKKSAAQNNGAAVRALESLGLSE